MLLKQDEVVVGDTVFSRFFRLNGIVVSLDEAKEVFMVLFSNGYEVMYKPSGMAVSVIPHYSRNDLEWWDITKLATTRKDGTVEIKNAVVSITE